MPWYIENFLRIRNKRSELVPFVLNSAQKYVMNLVIKDVLAAKPLRYIVLKARQLGISTLFEALIFHDTSTNSHKNAMIVAHEEQGSQNLFAMSKLFYENLPPEIRPMKKYANGKVLAFENPTTDENEKYDNPGLRSKISIATAGSAEVGRSSTTHLLHTSEVAFFPDAKTTMLGLLQSVPDEPNTMVVMESTANGVGDWFHDMWQKATRGENDFTPIFLPWFIDLSYSRPFSSDAAKHVFEELINTVTYDEKGREIRTYEHLLMSQNSLTLEQMNWRGWVIRNKCQGDEELFMQEYPSTPEEAFIASGRPKFNISALKKYLTLTTPALKRGYLREENGVVSFIPDEKGYISIWKEPQYGKFYSLGADVAEGLVHGDFSAGVVGDNESFDVVALWHGHIDPDLFGVELVKLARYYNDAYLGVENNNHGLTTLNTIKKLEYWNIYFSKVFDRISEEYTQKIGWSTTPRTKPLMIDKLAEYIREMYIGLYSDVIVNELFTYVIADDGKTNAQSGCNDDTIMAMGVLLQLMLEGRGEEFAPEVQSEGKNKTIQNIIDPLFEEETQSEEYSA